MNFSTVSTIKRFRFLAVAEGISYLILLFIAMPLKYFAQSPEGVKYAGWAHGLLFVLYVLVLIKVWWQYNWSIYKVVAAFIAALLPFGTFVLEKQLRKEYFT